MPTAVEYKPIVSLSDISTPVASMSINFARGMAGLAMLPGTPLTPR